MLFFVILPLRRAKARQTLFGSKAPSTCDLVKLVFNGPEGTSVSIVLLFEPLVCRRLSLSLRDPAVCS
eukprot:SAG22_NODE_2_length_61565_cov_858.782010_3_plen_68_part_00